MLIKENVKYKPVGIISRARPYLFCFILLNQDAWQCDICGSKSGRGFGKCPPNIELSHATMEFWDCFPEIFNL